MMNKYRLISSGIAMISIILMGLLLPLPARAGGTVGSGDALSCTEAALNAALVGGGFINFNCGPNPWTITLTSVKTIAADTTIDGGGLISLDGGASTRHFTVNSNSTLTLLNITLVNGSATPGGAILNNGTVNIADSNLSNNQAPGGSGGAIYNPGILNIYRGTLSNNGAGGGIAGAIYNLGSLTIVDSTLDNNSTFISGGSLANYGTADITSSLFEANQASNAGAIFNAGTITITGSTFNYNSAFSGGGGGIYNESVLSINRSIFFGNSVSDSGHGGGLLNTMNAVAVINKSKFVLNDAPGGIGGGIANEGQLSILASQFAGNHANGGLGGGLYSIGSYPLVITNSTFSGNTGFIGGGAYISGNPTTILNNTFADNANDGLAVSSGVTNVKNTILAANSSMNCQGIVTSQGYNLDDGTTCAFAGQGDMSNTNPMLGPIQDNGGPTWTHALLAGSPAINAGTNSGCPGTDQRGVMRPLLGTCDIGAYEYGFVQTLPILLK